MRMMLTDKASVEKMIRNVCNPSSNEANPISSGFPDAIFVSVLQEIFSQAKSEIEESRTHSHAAPCLLGSKPQLGFPPPDDEIYPCDALIDPALFHISDILSEQDEHVAQEPYSTMNARSSYESDYQPREDDIADLLKVDSPSLTRKTSGEFSIQEMVLSPNVNMQGLPSPPENGLPYLPAFFLHPLENNLFPVDWWERPQSYVNCQEMGAIFHGENIDMDSPGVRGNINGTYKSLKSDKCLKPRKERVGCRKKGNGKAMGAREIGELVDLTDLFWQSAQAVGVNNMKRALEILKKIKQHVSPYGNGAQRLGYYFAEALDARFSGTGWPLYLGLLHHHRSPAEVLKATSVFIQSCPFTKASHYFINQTILNVAKGASKLQIMDLQIADGYNYPSLIEALAQRPEGPPFLRLIGFGFPHYSVMPVETETILERVQKTGRQLSDIAAKYGVPFEFVPWAGMRDNIVMEEFVSGDREKDDVLVIISAYLLRYVMDETIDSPNTRSKTLKMGRNVNPDVYIQGIVTGAYNTPFFTRRFREALFHFESLFDVLDTFIGRDDQDRLVFESEIWGKAIMNIVACEGMEVVERIDKYKHWQAITEEAGFRQLPLNEEIKQNVQAMLKTWHKEYTVSEDSHYMLMGWKGRVLHAMSTWKASSS